MQIERPKRKVNCFVSRIPGVKIYLDDVKVVNTHHTENGTLFRLWIPRTSYVYRELQDIDKQCLETILAKNGEWFNNNLTYDQIKDYYRPCLDTVHDTIIILSRGTQNLTGHQEPCQDASLCIELEGLFFYSTKCGPKWRLRNVVKTDPGDLQPDKQEIDSQWERDAQELRMSIKMSKDRYTEYCDTLNNDLNMQLQIITAESEMSEKWSNACEELARLIKNFKSF